MTSIVKRRASRNLKIKDEITKRKAIELYCLLIQNRLSNPIRETMHSITEVHHIIPRCVCRWKRVTESKRNLIRLYAHEHFLAHYYLTIIFPHNIGVQRAFYLMSNLRGKKRYQHLDYIMRAYEIAKTKLLKDRKNKTYVELYGPTIAQEIKIKQKKSKLKNK